MSGGSWDYIYGKFEEVADRLQSKNQTPLRRALGKHISKTAKAMHSIEWNDSGDGDDDEEKNIKAALGKDSDAQELSVLLEDAQKIMVALQEKTDSLSNHGWE